MCKTSIDRDKQIEFLRHHQDTLQAIKTIYKLWQTDVQRTDRIFRLDCDIDAALWTLHDNTFHLVNDIDNAVHDACVDVFLMADEEHERRIEYTEENSEATAYKKQVQDDYNYAVMGR